MNKIDLSPAQRGVRCTVCESTGAPKIAKLFHKELGPTCYECFADLLNIEMRLRALPMGGGR